MYQQVASTVLRKRFSLSVYISLLLALTAIIPLLVTTVSVAIILRPALIAQISADMERSAQTRVQLIDTYLAERQNDIKTLSQAASVRSLLAGNQNSRNQANDVLFTTLHRDVANYISLSLISSQGNVVLSYPAAPQMHGKYLIQPEALAQIQQSGKIIISNVFYDAVANNASVDLYVRVVGDNFQLLGIIRASLGLHRLWEPVDSETQANGASSYAFVLDQNGVRIAYTNPDHSGFTHPPYLFKAIAPLSAGLQQSAQSENLYGSNRTTLTSLVDPALADIQKNTLLPLIFQFDPAGQNQTFEAARFTSTVVPWTYFLVKPLNDVTGLADQQLFGVLLIAAFMLLLAVVIGLQTGRRITLPIQRSVTSLRKNSLSLKTLADEEQVVANEQSWMVEASQVSLHSIKYYTNAASVATQRLSAIGTDLVQNQRTLNASTLNKSLHEMLEASAYIERVMKHQEDVNEKLATALRVTTQATQQLTVGAKSTDDAATQLEQIVLQLTAVVGEQDTRTAIEENSDR